MWHKTIQMEYAGITCEAVWAVLTDVANWHAWDPDIEFTEVDKPVGPNVDFYLKPKGGPKTRLTINRWEPPFCFGDVSHLPLGKMHTMHRLIPIETGIRVEMDIRVTGILAFLWSRVIAQKQIDSGPDQTARLIEKARQK